MPAGSGGKQLDAPEDVGQRKLQPDIELTELGVLSAHGIEPHFVNDAFDVEKILGEKRHAPFCIVETGRAGDELPDAPGIPAANSPMPGHKAFALLETQAVPVLLCIAAFAHRVETKDRPVGQVGIETVGPVLLHARPKFRETVGEGRGVRTEILFALKLCGKLLLRGRVLAALGHGQETEHGFEYIGPEGKRDPLFECAGREQIRCEQHETDVRLGCGHCENKQLTRPRAAGFQHKIAQARKCRAFLRVGELMPRAVGDGIEQMQHVPAFAGG